MDERQRSTSQVVESVHRTTISHALCKSGLYRRVESGNPLLKENHSTTSSVCSLSEAMWGAQQTCGRRYSGPTKPKLNYTTRHPHSQVNSQQ